jgi:hypothetical protein
LIEVLDDHRAPLGGDSAGEASADRDPDSLFDLLLDSQGSTRHQLGPLVVQEQDRARVGVEQAADALQERREQLVQLE